MEGYQAFEHLSAATRTTLRCGHGRPKDICGECFPTETKIDRDREFDQTAKTEPVIISAGADRSISPAILEFRIQELDCENRDLKEQLAVANKRIAGYERYYASFAQKIDEFETAFKVMTGESVAVFIGNRNTAHEDIPWQCETPGPFGLGHVGMCSNLKAAVDRVTAEAPMDDPHDVITIAAGKCTNVHCRIEGDHFGPCQIDPPSVSAPPVFNK